MRNASLIFKAAIVVPCVCGFNGCGGGKPGGETAAESADAHEHEHAAEGPHGGHIIELGNEDYHAELTHDDTEHRIGVHFLGSDAKTAKPIKAASVTINVSEDSKPSQYTLPAVPQAGEAEGSSSYFEIVSEPLCAVVCGESEAERTHARMNVMIDEKPYVGLIETGAHEHDHDHDHGHAH